MWRILRAIPTIILFLVYSLQVSAQTIPNFDNKSKGGEVGQTIAFVGEKIGFHEIEEHCPENSICMDALFIARYKVDDVLAGDYQGETIDFIAYDHYGTPRFSKQKKAVIYIYQAENGYIHHKYSYDVLSSIKGGTYAFCGDPYSDYTIAEIDENGRDDLEEFEFTPQIKVNLSDYLLDDADMEDMDQDNIRENFLDVMRKYSPPAFQIRGNKAICKMGMSTEDLVNVRMEYEYDPQRERDELRTKCWAQSGLADEGANMKMMEESGFNKCMKDGE